MFVSHRYRLFFFEVPRTASRSVSKALGKLDPVSPTALKRSVNRNSRDYHYFDRSLVATYPDYPLIAVHRNPYERILSHYKLRKVRGNPEILKTLTFKEYIDASFGKTSLDVAWLKDSPITKMLPMERVTHWLAFDSLHDDWSALAASLDVPLPDLPRINASKPNSDAFYTPTIASAVATFMQEDFDYFDYDYESWKQKPVDPKRGRQTGRLKEPSPNGLRLTPFTPDYE